MSNQEYWEKFLTLVKEELSGQAYQTWFESINMLSLDKSEITIEVPNRFHYEWLDSKYSILIKHCLKEAFGQKINVKYSVIIDTKPPNVSSELDSTKKIDDLIPRKYHRESQLNHRYTFKRFVEGRGNQFANAAASSVADSPGICTEFRCLKSG